MVSFGDLLTEIFLLFFFLYTRITHINLLSCGAAFEMQKVSKARLPKHSKSKIKTHFHGPRFPLF